MKMLNFYTENSVNRDSNFDIDKMEARLRKHLEVIKQELKENGGVPPKHRIDEEKRLNLI